MGLISVSPVDRVAIIASTELMATASSVIHQGIPKTEWATVMVITLAIPRPIIHQEFGICIDGGSISSPSAIDVAPGRKVLRIVRQDNARFAKASAIMMATPGHSNHPRGPSA
jgi:hypothetical protein